MADCSTTIQVDAALYSVEVIESALYRLSASLTGSLSTTEGGSLSVDLVASTSELTEVELKQLFRIALVDESLREKVETRTADMRNLILAHAFSRSGIADADSD